MLFPKRLAQRETQTASSEIWSQVIDSIFYNDNRACVRACAYIYANPHFWRQR